MLIVKDIVKHGKGNPYNIVHRHIVNDMRLSGDAFRLYIVFWNAKNTFQPTTKTLASQFKVDDRTIKRWMKELKDLGYITTTGSTKNTVINVHPLVS